MGAVVDLGAQWVHCADEGNPMLALASDVGVALVEEGDGSVQLFDEQAATTT